MNLELACLAIITRLIIAFGVSIIKSFQRNVTVFLFLQIYSLIQKNSYTKKRNVFLYLPRLSQARRYT